MGCGSQHFSMIFIITLLVLLSSQSTHILTVAGSLFNAVGSFQVHGLPEMYFIVENDEKQIKKISGLDENEEKQALIVDKFRSLLGLRSFHTKVPSNGDLEFLSPSPSPSPLIEEAQAPAPSPSPLPHLHHHSHHPRHHKNPPLHQTHHEDRGRAKRILIAVLVSAGVATLIGACGLFLVWRKFSNHTKKPKRTMPLYSKSKGSGGTYQSSSSKVSLNSGLDLFYLNALGEDIEQHGGTLKKTCKDVLEYDNVSGSSTKEIASVHEDAEVEAEAESDGGNSPSGDKIIPEDFHSSDDESFHSFVDSHSNNRLSNASACSLNDTNSLSRQNSSSLPNQFLTCPHNSIPYRQPHQPSSSTKHEEQETETTDQCSKTFTSPPPPPPPPPPPLQMPLFSLHSLTSSSRVSSHSPLSLTSNNLSSPVNSDTFSGSNQSPEKELPSTPEPYPTHSPPNIPPPPCPPPFLKGNSNSAKTPPPPPSQLPQFTPLGKDGAPLPKLKPLHWDKVRAAPNRTMVWDKLRSSSFE